MHHKETPVPININQYTRRPNEQWSKFNETELTIKTVMF